MLVFALAAGLFQPSVNTLDQETLKNYLEQGSPFDFILIDIREPEEITAAIGTPACKPYNISWTTQFKELSAKIPKDLPVIVYCRSGGRATRAASFLSESGFTRVYNAGGILTWKGPTIPPAEMKALALLPEFSCKAKK
jgi:rhodanese-related sulfurtransferase